MLSSSNEKDIHGNERALSIAIKAWGDIATGTLKSEPRYNVAPFRIRITRTRSVWVGSQ